MDDKNPIDPHRGQSDDFQDASQATAEEEYNDYTKRSYAYAAPQHSFRKVLIAFLIVVLVGAVGFGAYWFLLKKDDNNKASTNTSQPKDEQSTEPLIAEETEHYTSTSFMLEFDYPKDWKVSESTGEGTLVATSPALQLKQSDGKTVTGQVAFTIRNKQQALPEFDAGNATAVLASEKINYTKPSSVQRGSTYVSFLTYAGSAQPDRLDGLYITGDVGYQKGQAIPKADFTPVDPVISLTFAKCSGDNCSGELAAIGVDASMWQQTDFGTPLKALFQSLVIN